MLNVHFLNVGHGDCTVISHPSGRLTVVDINNGVVLDDDTVDALIEHYGIASAPGLVLKAIGSVGLWYGALAEEGYDISLANPVEFLKGQYPGKRIWRYVQTHPHMDHMRGLAALRQEKIGIDNLWDTEHTCMPFLEEADQLDWSEYVMLRGGTGGCSVLRLARGAKGVYYGEEPAGVSPGDGIEILHPPVGKNTAADSDTNPNSLSYILRLEYRGIVCILGGDATEAVWQEVAETCPEKLKCHVLKASHHGRDSGFCEDAVKLMSPQYTIVSVGKKPAEDASNRYRNYSTHVWSTRWRGNIHVTVEGTGQANIASDYDR